MEGSLWGLIWPSGGGVSPGWVLGPLSSKGCLQGPALCLSQQCLPEATTFPVRLKEKIWGAGQIWRMNSHTCVTTRQMQGSEDVPFADGTLVSQTIFPTG